MPPSATKSRKENQASVTRSRVPAKIRPPSLTDRAYASIEEMIVTLELAPGETLSETELAARLEIGRTPVREALQRLAREHLVQILPQRGILVAEIDVKRQLRLLETRREVERLVARCAARRATDDERQRFASLADEFELVVKTNDQPLFVRADKAFNELSVAASRNEFAAGAMGLMHGLSRRFWFMHHRDAADTALMAKLHGDISRAIALGDGDAAASACDALMDYAEAFVRATVSVDF